MAKEVGGSEGGGGSGGGGGALCVWKGVKGRGKLRL